MFNGSLVGLKLGEKNGGRSDSRTRAVDLIRVDVEAGSGIDDDRVLPARIVHDHRGAAGWVFTGLYDMGRVYALSSIGLSRQVAEGIASEFSDKRDVGPKP